MSLPRLYSGVDPAVEEGEKAEGNQSKAYQPQVVNIISMKMTFLTVTLPCRVLIVQNVICVHSQVGHCKITSRSRTVLKMDDLQVRTSLVKLYNYCLTDLGLQELGDVEEDGHHQHRQDVKYQVPGGAPEISSVSMFF